MEDQNELITAQDYADAINVQNACNLSGVVISFAKVMRKIVNTCNTLKQGTTEWNKHPIAVMYASKISSLTGECGGSSVFCQAYDFCKKVARDGNCKIYGEV